MAQEVIINVKANTKEAEASLQGVNGVMKGTEEATGKVTGAISALVGGIVLKIKTLATTIKGFITTAVAGFKSLRVALISTGIGAVVLAVIALKEAFTRSEEGQNKYAKLMAVIGSVTSNLLDLIADLGEGIIKVFENPKQAIQDFKNLIVENITNRFNSLLETVGYVGKAIKLVFQGEFSQALDVGKKAASSLVDSFTGIPDTLGKAGKAVKDFGKEIADDAANAAKIADQRAGIDKRSRQLLVDRANAERDIADLREKAADRDKYSAEERIKFLEEAGQISEDLANKEIEIAQLKFEAKKLENSLSKSTKEDLEEQAQLEADVINKETARLRLQKALTAQISTTRKEAQAARDAEDKERQKEIDDAAKAQKDKDDAIDKIREEYRLKRQEKEAQTNLQKAELEEQRKLAELEALGAELAQKQEVRDYYAGVKLEAEAKDAEASKAIEEKALADKEAIRQRNQDLSFSATTGLLGALSDLNSIYDKKNEKEAKRSFERNKKLQVALTIVSTLQAAQQAYASQLIAGDPTSPIRGAIAAGIALVSGYARVRVIEAQRYEAPQQAEPQTGGGGNITAQSQAPQFNVIGGGAQNQLAGLLADQTQKPLKAYVVSNEVTTAQSLDRNIVESATLG